ncbi:type III polyketide synthase [Prosthecobacter vanneervenii]|uniref:Putative naringenin-chalcone synthase n=1 Tax=Prosthecobacter vanneervenii TaxID=48466 RepID=A0A7W8DJX2_9BACT|nr:type III polyketide synthase [Prosthecobacter vanneervenii]MBB5032522.1 putative naringenin-chalcone synthase [Prosthecobacter vanneervenii]
MPAYIHHIATETPEFIYSNEFTRDRMKGWISEPRAQRLVEMIYDRTGIETRYSASDDFMKEEGALFRTQPDGSLNSPGTGERNALYAKASRELAVKLARKTLAECPHFAKEEITHIVFASCTGFANPGPDYHIMRELGLNESVERYTVGFMGCYAAFPALRMAAQFCEANPQAVVLVMCLELCSLHLQVSEKPESIVANALFADGAAAAIVSAREPQRDRPSFRVHGFRSALVPSSEAHMAWDIGNNGFNMVLSAYVPELIGSNIRDILGGILDKHGLSATDIDEWAVHPGGRAILDQIEQQLALPASALEMSRSVLRDYGNMSSPTVMFVLKGFLEEAETKRAMTCAIAFGPGLTVETAVLERCGAAIPPVETVQPAIMTQAAVP